jgi:hypothetical protein
MFKHFVPASVLATALILVGCASMSNPDQTPADAAPAPTEGGKYLMRSPQDWAQFVVDGKYVVVNNVWNKNAAAGTYTQEVYQKEVDGKKVFGWTWNGKAAKGEVLAYPEVNHGSKPWDAPSTLKSEFPFAAGSKKITVDFDVALRAKGVYNMAFSMWVVSALPPTKETITHEIMIWNHNSGMSPAGSPAGTLDVAGVTYDMYLRQTHGDISGANANQWTYIAFVARQPVFSASLPLAPFIDHLLQKGIITPKGFIANLEFGNEVISGEGTAEIRRFDVH